MLGGAAVVFRLSTSIVEDVALLVQAGQYGDESTEKTVAIYASFHCDNASQHPNYCGFHITFARSSLHTNISVTGHYL